MKVILILNKIVSYIPLVWLLFFGVFLFRTYLKTGYLPSYGHPDPKDLEMPVNYNFTFWGLPVTVFSIIFWVITLVGITIIDKKKIVKLDLIIYIFFYIAVCFLLRSKNLGLGEWLMD